MNKVTFNEAARCTRPGYAWASTADEASVDALLHKSTPSVYTHAALDTCSAHALRLVPIDAVAELRRRTEAA